MKMEMDQFSQFCQETLALVNVEDGKRLAELLDDWVVKDQFPVFFYHNFVTNPSVRIRPCFKLRVRQKVQLLLQQGWMKLGFVIARLIPNTYSTNGDAIVINDESKPCLYTIDGYHRLDAVGLLEKEGYGPSIPTGINHEKWPISTLVLREGCPDNICRAIAWALTETQKFSHTMTSIDILYAVQTIATHTKDEITVEKLVSEFMLPNIVMRKSILETALSFFKCIYYRPSNEKSPYEEIVRLASQNHLEVREHAKEFCGILADSSRLTDSCFLPMMGSAVES